MLCRNRQKRRKECSVQKSKVIMIDEKKIEEAKETFIADKKILGVMAMNDLACGFKEGAKWAINEFLKDLWHPNTEEPDKSKSDIITLGFDNDAYLQFKESILWNEESWRHSISRCQIIKWAYLSDILPKQKGGEQ